MPSTPAAVRSFGTSRVRLATADGSFVGRFAIERIGDRAVVALFAVEGEPPDEPRVIDIDRIESIERADAAAGAP